MKSLLTLLFWGSVMIGGFWVCFSALFNMLPFITVALFSPALAFGLIVGVAASRRH